MAKKNPVTEQWLLELQQKGYKIHDPIIDQKLKKAFGLPSKHKKTSQEKDHIEWVLIGLKIPFTKEYKGIPDRAYRFDFAIIDTGIKIAIEYNGIMSEKSRHTSITGYTEDMRKLNLAQINGWIVLQYTPLNYKEVSDDLHKILHLKPFLSNLGI
jgi:hypothetical protein